MTRALDLAARPFVNRRPVVRLALLLWLAGGALLAGNLWLYWDFLAGRGDVHARRLEVEEAIAIEERRISGLAGELAGYDLEAQNEQVAYLNQRIDQRRFSWSRLFDELAGLLPRDVRIQSLTPGGSESGGGRAAVRRGADGAGDGRVVLGIQAEARSDEAILELVDALFADRDFERPNLIQQAAAEGGLVRFSLDTIYRPPAALETAGGAELLSAEGGAAQSPEAEDGERQPPVSALDRPAASPPVRLGRPASSPPETS
ncbi:MAG TPA: PilN domain-containing protein [Thermoanaerobaculia bacterium]|nr:PilN domain-containing protein [Thermoanaerobaculia bacterium]